MKANSPPLVDRFGRKVDYVRMSVTDRCDFRCVYCMAEEMTFLPRDQVLSLEEIYTLASVFAELGVRKIRLTGGEPLVRKNVMSLIRRMGRLAVLDELTLTTNGSQLTRLAGELRDAGVRRINVSLDSLDADKFLRITRTGKLKQVLAGLDAAAAAGFERIKLNAEILKGRNEEEILDLADYAQQRGFDISYIEEMPLGLIDDHDRALSFCSSDEVRDVIESSYQLTPCEDTTGGPSRYYAVEGSAARIGFISPHSHNFCHLCNRVRVTVEGRLLLCLGNEHSVDLRAVLRGPDFSREKLRDAIITAMDLKPEKHHFDLHAQPEILRFMNMTGG